MKINLKDDIIRYVLRRRRKKELNKSTRDIEDFDISKGSVSNIEKKGNVKPDTLEIYLKKIGLTEDEVIKRAKALEEEMKEVYYQLETIETIIEDGDLKAAKEQLERFQFEEFYPLTPNYFFLQGLICSEEKDIEKAQNKFKQAIKVCKDYALKPRDNIIAACYAELAACSHLQHDLQKAIKYADQGLEAYDETKNKKGIKYKILGNKTMYLLKSSNTDQASRLLDKVWPEVEKLDHGYEDYPVLNLYKFRSTILRDQGHYGEALQCCNKGQKLARRYRSSSKSHYLDFIILSGSIFLLQKEFTKAFERFQLALDSDRDFKSPRRHMDVHTYFGILFTAKKEWPKATMHVEEALKIGKERPDAFRLAKALIVRGNICYSQKQFSEAIPYYQEAASLAERHGYKQRQYTALLKLADCFDNLDEKEKLRDCTETMYRLQKWTQDKKRG
ncbi:tetratricopeptide repeat protein [Lihuaxuella thermophila]|uniref:Tetratricopeptide repeat-containing protein n=1 Tax=Lihuaxuella thermophila TaxID=1173111 RepID=A0A1H8AUN4_9BACL|nr:tetratricopeptide repeat protein [Lihuaxuella thermophila]SEM73518.1 Tetratricopeptide repeat-containing protein [Lihuaxuella thermophila]